jgi:putative membrane protein
MGGMMGSMMGRGFMGNRMLFSPYGGVIVWLLILIVIGVAVYFIVRSQKGGGLGLNLNRETPLEILKKRYARGEITGEEYEEMRKALL